jgi:hypothetical protein
MLLINICVHELHKRIMKCRGISLSVYMVCMILYVLSFLMTFFDFLFLQNQSVALTWNVEDLMPPTERYIFNFNSKEELKKWHLYSDSEYGGMYILDFNSMLHSYLWSYAISADKV